MKFDRAVLLVPLLGIAVLAAVLVAKAAEELDDATKARLAKAETGPSTIDVSAYPAALQEAYPLFLQKCAQCHKISRAINSDYALPDEWERYVKRMMHKPGSGIDRTSGKQIYEFLVYDSATRKKDLQQQKMAALPEAERAASQAKLKEVLDAYK